MKLCTVAYLPPKSWGCAQAFYDNLQKYPPAFPLLTYSETSDWPGALKLNASPEMVKGSQIQPDPRSGRTVENRFAVNNLAFYTGMLVAIKNGFTHAIYLEADCRVGVKEWDARIFEETFSLGRPLITAGTVAVYNPCNYSLNAAKRWEELVSRNVRRNVPIATYGYKGAAERHESCVFPNGAFSVLDLNWIQRLFDLSNTPELAKSGAPWDMGIGMKIWERFGENSYDVVGHINCIYSSYGDVLTTEAERIAMLRNGIVGVHQVKSNVVI